MVEAIELTSVVTTSGANNAQNASRNNDRFDPESIFRPIDVPRFKWDHESEKRMLVAVIESLNPQFINYCHVQQRMQYSSAAQGGSTEVPSMSEIEVRLRRIRSGDPRKKRSRTGKARVTPQRRNNPKLTGGDGRAMASSSSRNALSPPSQRRSNHRTTGGDGRAIASSSSQNALSPPSQRRNNPILTGGDGRAMASSSSHNVPTPLPQWRNNPRVTGGNGRAIASSSSQNVIPPPPQWHSISRIMGGDGRAIASGSSQSVPPIPPRRRQGWSKEPQQTPNAPSSPHESFASGELSEPDPYDTPREEGYVTPWDLSPVEDD